MQRGLYRTFREDGSRWAGVTYHYRGEVTEAQYTAQRCLPSFEILPTKQEYEAALSARTSLPQASGLKKAV